MFTWSVMVRVFVYMVCCQGECVYMVCVVELYFHVPEVVRVCPCMALFVTTNAPML